MGIERTRPWDINDPSGFLTERLYGSDAFFDTDVFPDFMNSSRNVFMV